MLGNAAYCLVKGDVRMLARAELANHNIFVTTGAVLTPIDLSTIKDSAKRGWMLRCR